MTGPGRPLRSAFLILAASVAAVVGFAPNAGAHTEFESSDPGDGAVVAGPVSTVTIVFTNPADPAGDGFQVLDPTGAIRQPTSTSSGDGRTWVLEFGDPLVGGEVGVRWMVKAGDAHPIDGSFSFTAGGDPVGEPGPDEAQVAEEQPTPTTGAVREEPDGSVHESGGSDQEADLESFLAEDGAGSSAAVVAAIGRIMRLLGVVIGLGALVFVSYVLGGGRNETGRVLMWIRRCSVLAVVGALVVFFAAVVRGDGGEWSSLASPSAYGDLIGSSRGLSLLLGVLGGVALGLGATDRPARPVDDSSENLRWRPTGLSLAGAAMLLASFVFSGHTVTEGNRILTSIADVVHVGTAAVWAGGVAMLSSVVRHRRARGGSQGIALLAGRFSVVAAYSLSIAGLAGVALAVAILDSPSQLWSSSWGRLLCLKVVFVAAAAAAGGYNHFVLVPALESDPEDASAVQVLRRVLSVETILVVAVIGTTGILVGTSV